MDEEKSPEGRGLGLKRSRKGPVLVWCAVAGVTFAAGFGLAGIRTPVEAASESAGPTASWITAPVDYRPLAEVVVGRGDVDAPVSIAVVAPESVEEKAVLTAPSADLGSTIHEGQMVAEVSGRPAFVLEGAIRAFRTIRPGMKGIDISQLQAGLVRLGYQPDLDGYLGNATKSALSSFYADRGYEPVETGAAVAADLTSAAGAVSDAEIATAEARDTLEVVRRANGISQAAADIALQAALREFDNVQSRASEDLAAATRLYERAMSEGEDSRTGSREDAIAALAQARRQAAISVATANDAVTLARENKAAEGAATTSAIRSAERALQTAVLAGIRARDELNEAAAASGPSVPLGEVVFVPAFPAVVTSTQGEIPPGTDEIRATDSESGSAPETLLTLAVGDPIVRAALSAADANLLRPGMSAEILDEENAETFEARVESIGRRSAQGGDGSAQVEVVLKPRVRLPSTLSGRNVRVSVAQAATNRSTLVVPVAAIFARADGTDYVSVLESPVDTPVDVPVVAGASAGGYVEVSPITPRELDRSDRVVVGR